MSDVDSEMRALIALARRVENPTLADRARVRRGIAVTLGAAGAAATSAASGAERAVESGTHFAAPSIPAAAKAGAWLGALKGSFGQAVLWVALGTATGGGAWYLARSSPAESPKPPAPAVVGAAPAVPAEARGSVPATPPLAAPAEPAAPSAAPAEEELEFVSPEPPAAEASRELPAPRAPARAAAALPRLSLAEEARELSAVHAALHRGESAAALARLDAMDRRRGGALREERLAARVLSLCALGRVREAESVARRFQSLAPESPLLPRLTASCAQRVLGD